MNPESREDFRKALLRVLDANNTRFGLGAKALGHLVASYGFPSPNQDDVKSEVQYLEDKELVSQVMKGVSPENRCWRITAAGRDFVAQLTNE